MQYNWSKYVILVAEDDPINFRYLQLLLEKRTGVKILWAKNGLEAHSYIKKQSCIDLVLLDLQLPDLNGFEVLTFSKKCRTDLPVIMQTANTWNNEDEKCIAAGCDGFFTKPLDVDKLFKRIDKCLLELVEKKLERQG